MALDPGTNAHFQLGKAWGVFQTLTSKWTVSKYTNINALAAKIRKAR